MCLGEAAKELKKLSVKLKKAGIHFSFATGRSKVPALKYARGLDIDIPIICSGGAIITDTETGTGTGTEMILMLARILKLVLELMPMRIRKLILRLKLVRNMHLKLILKLNLDQIQTVKLKLKLNQKT